jgi:hypothetical protein
MLQRSEPNFFQYFVLQEIKVWFTLFVDDTLFYFDEIAMKSSNRAWD